MLTSAVKDGAASETARRQGGVAEPMLWVALAAVLAYAGTLAYGFVWDDHALIGYRAHLFTPAHVPDLLASEFFAFTPQRTHYWRPFITVTLLWDHFAWGLRPLGFHLTNLVAHTAVSLGVFGLGMRLGRRPSVGLAAGLLFALHPVHGEAVAFISGRTDLFAGLFSLGALLAHGRARSSGRWGWTLLSALCFALGLLSKETVALLPLLLVALDWAENEGPSRWRPRLVALVPQALVFALYLVLRGAVLGRMVNAVEAPWAEFPARILASVRLAALYGQVALLPVPERIWWVVPKEGFPPGGGWWLAAAWLTLLLGLTGYACLRSRRAGFACLWFWITLAPAVGINLLPVAKEVAAERFLYLPTVGICLLAGLGLGWLDERLGAWAPGLRRLARVSAVVVLAGLGAWAWSRSLAWRDDHRLALRMVETSPEARLPRQNLGLSFLQRGDYAQARAHLEKALALGSASLSLQGTLGVVEATLGQRDQGLARALRAAQADPGNPTLAALVADVHRVRGEQAEALAWLDTSLRLNPGSVETRLNRAGALISLDRLDEAAGALREAEALLPVAGMARLTFARLQADLESRRDPAAAAGRWARLVVELRALPERTSAQALDLAYAERKLTEGARAPRR